MHVTSQTGELAVEPVAEIFRRDSLDPAVLVVDGLGVSITVNRGHLVIRDGVGQYGRLRRLPKVERTVKRIVMLAHSGYITLDAVRWCATVGITVVQVLRDGTVIGHSGFTSPSYPAVRRAQALAGASDNAASLGITSMLLTAKLTGQASIVEEVFGDVGAADYIRFLSDRMSSVSNGADECRSLEGAAGSAYWQTWARSASPRWQQAALEKILEHWRTFTARPSLTHEPMPLSLS